MAASRIRRNAVDGFRLRLQNTMACVTTETLLVVQTPRNPNVLTVTFPLRQRGLLTLRDRLGMARFHCSVDHSFALGTSSVVHTTGYAYHLYDSHGIESLAYHWHPHGSGARPEPHMHVRATIGTANLSRMHLPTGRMSLESFVRLLITEFAVNPFEENWQRILDNAEQAFIASRSWS